MTLTNDISKRVDRKDAPWDNYRVVKPKSRTKQKPPTMTPPTGTISGKKGDYVQCRYCGAAKLRFRACLVCGFF